jgi:hypothetical protein
MHIKFSLEIQKLNNKKLFKSQRHKWIINIALFYFSKHEFLDVKIKSKLLSRASAIRNRVAHSSEK